MGIFKLIFLFLIFFYSSELLHFNNKMFKKKNKNQEDFFPNITVLQLILCKITQKGIQIDLIDNTEN